MTAPLPMAASPGRIFPPKAAPLAVNSCTFHDLHPQAARRLPGMLVALVYWQGGQLTALAAKCDPRQTASPLGRHTELKSGARFGCCPSATGGENLDGCMDRPGKNKPAARRAAAD